jgi:hypothetical protein
VRGKGALSRIGMSPTSLSLLYLNFYAGKVRKAKHECEAMKSKARRYISLLSPLSLYLPFFCRAKVWNNSNSIFQIPKFVRSLFII